MNGLYLEGDVHELAQERTYDLNPPGPGPGVYGAEAVLIERAFYTATPGRYLIRFDSVINVTMLGTETFAQCRTTLYLNDVALLVGRDFQCQKLTPDPPFDFSFGACFSTAQRFAAGSNVVRVNWTCKGSQPNVEMSCRPSSPGGPDYRGGASLTVLRIGQ